jgi:hypothetical protein
MRKFGHYQLLGPAALFVALLGADGVAYALRRAPYSEILWYINLKWFGMFQASHYALAPLFPDGLEQLAFVGSPLLLIAIAGAVFRRSMLQAVASNLSFVYIVFVFLSWFREKAPIEASLSMQYTRYENSELLILFVLVITSLLSFVASHISYFRAARAGIA